MIRGARSFVEVLDTFGICSFEEPVECLRELLRVTKPGGKARFFCLKDSWSRLMNPVVRKRVQNPGLKEETTYTL